jgi:hypothetical protein
VDDHSVAADLLYPDPMSASGTPHDIDLQREGDLAVVRLTNLPSLSTAAERIDQAIEATYQSGLRKLLLVITTVPALAPGTGVDVPTLAQRSAMVRRWSQTSRGLVTVAMVCEPQFIDPQKFGVAVAANFGMTANVFSEEGEAREWLVVQG